MTPPTPTRLVVELEHDGESIAGSVRDTGGSSVAFSGWLGLAAAIEELAAPQALAHPPPRAA